MSRHLLALGIVLMVFIGALPAFSAVRLGVKADIEKERIRSGSAESETQVYVLDVQLASTADTDESVDVEWYFITRPLNEKGKKTPPQIIFGDRKSISIAAGKRVKEQFKSRPLKHGWKKQKKKKVYSGALFETYLVVVKQGDQIVQQNTGYAKYLKPEWMGQLKRARGGR